MASHSSILTWRILWTEVPGGLQLIGSQRVRYDLAALINTAESTEDLRHSLLTCLPSPSQKQDRSLFLSIMPSASHHEQRILPGAGWRDGHIKEFLPSEQFSLFPGILLVHRVLAGTKLNIYFLWVISNFRIVKKSWALEQFNCIPVLGF